MSNRREFLQSTVATVSALSAGSLLACNLEQEIVTLPSPLGSKSRISKLGPLLKADANGVRLPKGFSSRIVARSGKQVVKNSPYVWHAAPDGGATFATRDGGWIYASNSELDNKKGGVGALRFDAKGKVVDAYQILKNTTRNCGGGASPWGTWLSGEEIKTGLMWDCDPLGKKEAVPLPALGAFTHEAVAFDTDENIVYLTEDVGNGRFYRFVPDKLTSKKHPDLSSGSLEVAKVDKNSKVSWLKISDPSGKKVLTRRQQKTSTVFKGGEGIVYHKGVVSFSTKGDDRIWAYDVKKKKISVVYDYTKHKPPPLTGVDNVAVSSNGELLVAEDGGDLEIVIITREHKLLPLMQLVGHDRSEIAGPAFSPDGRRLYFSSQRGTRGASGRGITFEISGPFYS
jgi:secreted PhoX family phosphatase